MTDVAETGQRLCGRCNKPKGDGEGFCNCGRPTEYHDGVPDQMKQWFIDRSIPFTRERTMHGSKVVASQLPTFAGFAIELGVSRNTMDRWKGDHPEFRDAYEYCKEIQEEVLSQNALMGSYNAKFASLFAMTNLDYAERKNSNMNMKHDGAAALAEEMLGTEEE